MRYAAALEQLVFSRFRDGAAPTIVEFGSGTGEPVIEAVLGSRFAGVVHGYEINPEAAEIAETLIEAHGLSDRYIIHNISFFETFRRPASDYLIANPPYVPCEDRQSLILPDLCGGPNGNEVSKRLLSLSVPYVCLEISSYSDPRGTVEHARANGYCVADFMVTRMPFGIYSRQEIVQRRISKMREAARAFFSENCYLVGSAFFIRETSGITDLSAELLACLTSL